LEDVVVRRKKECLSEDLARARSLGLGYAASPIESKFPLQANTRVIMG
jgi:hypothetical protein